MSNYESKPMIDGQDKAGALVLFSGGQDSAVCLAWALSRFERVETVGFDYGQIHRVELEARQRVAKAMAGLDEAWSERLGKDHLLDLTAFGEIGETALTSERAIEIDDRGLPTTFVPGRNLVFLTVAAALADRRGHQVLVGGMCETDYSGYPDCRRDTLDALQSALVLGMARDLSIETPLMSLTKAQTWSLAEQLGGDELVELILEESHSCYRGDRSKRNTYGYGCDDCPACELRAKGWAEYRGEAAR